MCVCVCVCVRARALSHVQLFSTLWTVALQAPLSTGSSGKNAGVGCHAILLQGIFLTQGSNPHLLHLPELAGRFFTTEPPGKPNTPIKIIKKKKKKCFWTVAGQLEGERDFLFNLFSNFIMMYPKHPEVCQAHKGCLVCIT